MECFDSDVLPDLVARAAVNYGDSMIAFCNPPISHWSNK